MSRGEWLEEASVDFHDGEIVGEEVDGNQGICLNEEELIDSEQMTEVQCS